jgi:hypothetical protein
VATLPLFDPLGAKSEPRCSRLAPLLTESSDCETCVVGRSEAFAVVAYHHGGVAVTEKIRKILNCYSCDARGRSPQSARDQIVDSDSTAEFMSRRRS